MIKFSFKKKKKTQSDRNSWVLTHARGNLSTRDEESPNSCEDDTSSESSDSDDSSNDSSTYVEESFEVMFVPEEEIQQVTIVGMRESIGEDFFQVGGGVSLNIIIMWGGGGWN